MLKSAMLMGITAQQCQKPLKKNSCVNQPSFEGRMKIRVVASCHEKATMGRKSLSRDNPACGSVSGGMPNRCVIFPAKTSMVAEALERRNKSWIVKAKVSNDLIVRVGDSSFHLHKLAIVSKSGYLTRLMFQTSGYGEEGNSIRILIENLPGGAEIFELIVKFCYGWKVDVVASNIALLYSAGHFLEMSDDLVPGNLISKTEAFLSFVIFSSWKDAFHILKSCESISSWAKELNILKRCSEAIAWKVCINPKAFAFGDDDAQCFTFFADKNDNSRVEQVADNWWFEDVSVLRIDHFIEVIESIKGKGMKPEVIGSCIADWTRKWFSRMTLGLDNLISKHLNQQLQRFTAETLIRILPVEEKSVSCNFLLHLLKFSLMIKINSELLNELERRIASLLEHCCVSDLLVKDHGENDTVYDVGIVIKVVKAYASFVLGNLEPRLSVVGRLVEGYLIRVAMDKNLRVQSFQSLAEALPKSARYCDDNLYRAMDMYLKAHPCLTEEERTSVTRAMEYHKLSQHARQHAIKNGRLPLKVTTRFILLEQINMTKSFTTSGSYYRRTKTQAVIRAKKGWEKGWTISQNEIKTMKKEVEIMKVQLNKLQMCKIEIQRQAKRCMT